MKIKKNRKFKIILLSFAILIIVFLIVMIPTYIGDGWVLGKINASNTENSQFTIEANEVKGALKRDHSDYIGFTTTDKTMYEDSDGNKLNIKPELIMGQSIKVYYEYNNGEIIVFKIRIL